MVNKRLHRPRVISLMGPTASGKTDLALALSERMDVQVISVDSSQVYRDMDIGSAKPSAEELARAPHRLIDVCDPACTYSVADFCRDARREIDRAIDLGLRPLLVGGSMLYFRALLDGLSPMPEVDPEKREAINQRGERLGWPAMHSRLQEVDPDYAACIHPNHSQRIARALEVYESSGKTMSEWRQKAGEGLREQFDWCQIGLLWHNRTRLHALIEKRFDDMLERGFVDEVRQLYQRGDLSLHNSSMRAVGYRQIWQYLDGELDYDGMCLQAKAATRQLAKRQLTWLRSWKDLSAVHIDCPEGHLRSKESLLELCLNLIPE